MRAMATALCFTADAFNQTTGRDDLQRRNRSLFSPVLPTHVVAVYGIEDWGKKLSTFMPVLPLPAWIACAVSWTAPQRLILLSIWLFGFGSTGARKDPGA